MPANAPFPVFTTLDFGYLSFLCLSLVMGLRHRQLAAAMTAANWLHLDPSGADREVLMVNL